jgi:hypothetical protein
LFHSYRWIYEVNEFNKHSAAFKISLKRVIWVILMNRWLSDHQSSTNDSWVWKTLYHGWCSLMKQLFFWLEMVWTSHHMICFFWDVWLNVTISMLQFCKDLNSLACSSSGSAYRLQNNLNIYYESSGHII